MTNRRSRSLPIPQVIDPGVWGQAAAGNAATAQQQQQQTANALSGGLNGGLGSALGNPGAPTPNNSVGLGVTTTDQQRNPGGWSFGAKPGDTPSPSPAPQSPAPTTDGVASTIASGLKPAGAPAPTPPPASPAFHSPYAGVAAGATNYATGAGSGVKQNADGSYTLPNGTVLGQGNTFTFQVGNQQVRVPGNYNGSNQALWQNNGVGETAMDRFSRRMNDLAVSGANVNDPNIQYNEMARIRDDATGALTQQLGRPPTPQELVNATGFAHINNFVRGANGETGYTAAPGNPGPGAAPAPNPAAPNPAAPNPATSSTPPADAKAGDVNPADPNQKVVVNPVTGQKSYTALQDIALAGSDPDQVNTRRAMMMQSLGLDPTAQGLFYQSVNKNLGDAMDRYLALQGIAPGTSYGTITGNMKNFENMVTSGDYYGQLHNNALATRQAFLNGGNRGLNTGQQLSVLDQILGQNAEGMNPVLAQAMANRSQQARTQIGIDTANQLGRGQGEITDPVAWLRGSRWADLLG